MSPVWRLPRMTDPRGKHWGQPAGLRDRVRLLPTHAEITSGDWSGLLEYRNTTPSGVYAGKAWRCGDYLCWYGPDTGPTVAIGVLKANIIDTKAIGQKGGAA